MPAQPLTESIPLFRRNLCWAFVIAVAGALLAALLLLYTLHRGVGLENDAINYVSTARSLLAGRGFQTLGARADWEPLRVFPPGYPLILAAGGLLSGDPVTAAPYVQVVIFACTTALAVLLAFAAARSLLVAALAGALAASALMSVETMALSEGAFICVALAALWALAEYLRRGKRGWLIAAAVGFAAAVMIRYAGISLLVAGLIALVWLGRRNVAAAKRGWRGTMIDAVLLCAIVALPMATWSMRNREEGGVGRSYKFHPAELKQYHSVLRVAAGLLAPIGQKDAGGRKLAPLTNRTPLSKAEWIAAAEILVLAGLGVIYLASRQRRRRLVDDIAKWPGAELILVMLIYAAIYLPFLFFSISFFDQLTMPNYRILSPMIVPIILAAVGIGTLKLNGGRRPIAGSAAVGLLALVVALHGYRTLKSARETHRLGIGYQTAEWRQSQTLRQVKALPPGTLIYTNATDVLYLLADRLTCTLPSVANRKSGTVRDPRQVQEALGEMAKDLMRRGGVIVYFDNMHREDFLASKEQLRENLSLVPYAPPGFDGPPRDGAVWKVVTAERSR